MHYFSNFILDLVHYMFRAVPLPIIRSSTTVHSALVHVIQVLKTAFKQSRDVPSLLGLKVVFKTCMTCTNAECTVVELLMMGKGTARNV